MNLRIRKVNDIKYVSIYFIAFFSCFLPLYIPSTNQHNLLFVITEIPLFFSILSPFPYGQGRGKERLYFGLILLYFGVFFYYNVVYLQCYWAMWYKTAVFLFLWKLMKYEYNTSEKKAQFIEIITSYIIGIFTLAVLVSVIAYATVGLDSIFFNLTKFSYRRQGAFLDHRLTWVYLHKSAYGLILVTMIHLVLKKERQRYKKLVIGLYLIALVCVNSMVSLFSAVIILFLHYLGQSGLSRAKMIRRYLAFMAAILVGALGFAYVAVIRDVNSLGARMYIWNVYNQVFEQYPKGMGNSFYSVRFWVPLKSSGYSINNLHNVFANEMLHYSMPVGILYTVLLLYWPIKNTIQSGNKLIGITTLIALTLPMMFDQAMSDTLLLFYVLLLYLDYANRKVIRKREATYEVKYEANYKVKKE